MDLIKLCIQLFNQILLSENKKMREYLTILWDFGEQDEEQLHNFSMSITCVSFFYEN